MPSTEPEAIFLGGGGDGDDAADSARYAWAGAVIRIERARRARRAEAVRLRDRLWRFMGMSGRPPELEDEP